jgi:hypothetical protein
MLLSIFGKTKTIPIDIIIMSIIGLARSVCRP